LLEGIQDAPSIWRAVSDQEISGGEVSSMETHSEPDGNEKAHADHAHIDDLTRGKPLVWHDFKAHDPARQTFVDA